MWGLTQDSQETCTIDDDPTDHSHSSLAEQPLSSTVDVGQLNPLRWESSRSPPIPFISRHILPYARKG